MTLPTVSVIIPAYNAAGTLSQTLTALNAAIPRPLEIIVVDDGSTDTTARLAESFGARVLALPKNVGAAAAKNLGAHAAEGAVLLFTDSDIVPAANCIGLVLETFRVRGCDGIVGLLDESIPARNWASQFKNLWMNFTYARLSQSDRIGLFYTSIAAMKRATFLDLGGFDENYRGASIAEDTEFGQRAWVRRVPILLAPDVRVVHLKIYSVSDVLREDFKRAYALTLMRLRKWGEPFFTSVPFFYQLAVPTIYLTLMLAFGALVLQNPWLWLAVFVSLVTFFALNVSLLSFLSRMRSLGFALRAAIFLPADVIVVGLGMLSAFINFARGIRY